MKKRDTLEKSPYTKFDNCSYREGRFHEAVVIFEKSLEDFRRQGFEDGEIAALGNLYLACLAAGYEKKAFDYFDEYRKKRRKK